MELLEALEAFLHGFKFLFWAVASHLFPYRQNFYHWSLWVPVFTLYFLAVLVVVADFYPLGWLLSLLNVTLIVVIAAHLWGAYLHLDGVRKRVGGQNIHNHMIGPPVILPMIVATVATLDLLRLLQGGFT